jgi:N-acetylmuramoyl-L-alanine amidase
MSTKINHQRRKLIKLGTLLSITLLISPYSTADELLDLVNATSANNNDLNDIIAVRVWPSSVYSRITLESTEKIIATTNIADKTISVDIQNAKLNKIISTINSKVKLEDPIIQSISAAQLPNNIIRITITTKQQINLKVDNIKPVSLGSVEYRYRYVIDMYPPANENNNLNDDLLALLQLNDNFNSTALETNKKQPKVQSILAPRKNSNDKIRVMIDPGHGGEDPGAIGLIGTKEKDVVLDVGLKLYDIMQKSKHYQAFLTRSQDIFIPLGARVAIARKAKADIFISIHADAFTNRSANGASVFILSEHGASSSFAKYLAKTQNDSDLIGGMSFKNYGRNINSVLLDMTQTYTLKNSSKLAQILLSDLKHLGKLHSREVERAVFAVLKAPDIPSVLVETAFISNPAEEQLLRNEDFRQKLAQAIYNGIVFYDKLG